jgi:phosphohistidine swiveling domain-containing protein
MLAQVGSSIKRVWASLYSAGFIAYRKSTGYHEVDARMAVLLQQFINPRVSGVVHTFDQGSGRPGFWISAQPGIGEGVVQPTGGVDHWFLGQRATDDDILERGIATKEERVVIAEFGGTRKVRGHEEAACLDDDMVLRIARAAKEVQQHYHRLLVCPADHVDIEYVIDAQGRLFFVQARPKYLQMITSKNGKLKVKTTAVDRCKVPRGVKAVYLGASGLVAVDGAVSARLQLDRGPRHCIPGRIVVAHHTNNEYNEQFGAFAAVITADGDQTSHAAQHAYEKQIPCVVGAPGVVELLAQYNGRLVTLDAGSKTLYLAAVPIINVERPLDIWLTDESAISAFGETVGQHEIFRPWIVSKKKRPAVFREDFEGRIRLRSNRYGWFQLDYYYQAWDRLTEILTRMFGQRTRQRLQTQERRIKAIGKGQSLVHLVHNDDNETIYHYLMSVDGFGLDDLEALFSARLEGFQRFAAFVHGLKQIDESSVLRVVDELIEVFAWMHAGFWLDCVVESFAARHLRNVSNASSLHNRLRDEAVAGDDPEFRVDPLSPWMPTGRLLNLSRHRDRAKFALLEHIRSKPALAGLFAQGRRMKLRKELEQHFPDEFKTICEWSMRYKLTREDLDVASDTDEYLARIRKNLSANSTMPPAMLSLIYQDYLRKHHAQTRKASTVLAQIRRNDPELYLLCRAHTRAAIASASRLPLCNVEARMLNAHLSQAAGELHRRAIEEMRSRQATGDNVLHANFPNLKTILKISRLQVALREDGHHLIVPHQRKIARLMLEAAQQFVPKYLPTTEDVFRISTSEFVALFKETDPKYITFSLERRRQLLRAEQQLRKCWSVSREDFNGVTGSIERLWGNLRSESVGLINQYGDLQEKALDQERLRLTQLAPEFESDREAIFKVLEQPLASLPEGIRQFEAHVGQALEVLKRQYREAQTHQTKAAYRDEQAKLTGRLESLNRKARYAKYA